MTLADLIARVEGLTVSVRWRLFKSISALGWWVCPEPHKSDLQSFMPTWGDIRRTADERSRQADASMESIRRSLDAIAQRNGGKT